MTTSVKVEAHCADNKEVKIVINDTAIDSPETITLDNGGSHEFVIYDNIKVTIEELSK